MRASTIMHSIQFPYNYSTFRRRHTCVHSSGFETEVSIVCQLLFRFLRVAYSSQRSILRDSGVTLAWTVRSYQLQDLPASDLRFSIGCSCRRPISDSALDISSCVRSPIQQCTFLPASDLRFSILRFSCVRSPIQHRWFIRRQNFDSA